MKFKKIGIVADKNKQAQDALKALNKKYDFVLLDESDEKVDLIVALGGDGLMLHSLHRFMDKKIPIYGMNCGTIGFLMNEYDEENLKKKIRQAQITTIHPLKMKAAKEDGGIHEALAINEISLLRKSGQAAHLKISVDDAVHIKNMVCDGAMVSTPAGSSAYNFSIGGPILPIKSKLLALTPISPFRPRRWRGALLPDKVSVRLDVLDHNKRPVNVTADYLDVDDVLWVEVKQDRTKKIELLFDPGHSLEERILREQFAY